MGIGLGPRNLRLCSRGGYFLVSSGDTRSTWKSRQYYPHNPLSLANATNDEKNAAAQQTRHGSLASADTLISILPLSH
jgi:hypothetical protein